MGKQDGDAVWGCRLRMQDRELGSLPASSPALAAGAELDVCLLGASVSPVLRGE